MVRILYTVYQLHILNSSSDIVSARKKTIVLTRFFNCYNESIKGHNFAILGLTEKNTRSLIFVLMLHIKFQGSTQIGFQDKVGT